MAITEDLAFSAPPVSWQHPTMEIMCNTMGVHTCCADPGLAAFVNLGRKQSAWYTSHEALLQAWSLVSTTRR